MLRFLRVLPAFVLVFAMTGQGAPRAVGLRRLGLGRLGRRRQTPEGAYLNGAGPIRRRRRRL